MIISAKKKNEAFDILRDYEGENPYILTLKKEVYVNKNIDAIGNFQAEYILKNNNTSPKPINKIVKLADWYAEAKKEEWELDFVPDKIKIVTLLGETENTYNCYIQYRQSVPPQPCFLRKNGLLTNFLVEDYRKIEVDFDRYSRLSDFKRILFDHQKDAVKFLLSRKKCILADDMGLGKTTSVSVAAIEGNFDSVLIICPASIKEVWKRELSYYIPEKDITIIEGFSDKKKGELEVFLGYAEGKSNMTREQLLEEAKEHGQWKFNRFIIVNYDIVDNFFKSKRTYTKEQFDELLENNPMLKYINNRKSLIILDEAHNLSNSKSIRYKTIRGLINKGKPDSIYAVTGTPITNDPANLYCVLNLLGDSITSDWDYYMKSYCAAEEFCKDKEERNRWTQKFLEFKKKSTWYDLTKEEKDELKKYLHEHCKFILIPKGSSNLEELRDRISHIYLRRTKDSLTLPEKTIHEMYYDLTPSQEEEYNRLWEEYEEEKKTLDPEKEINKDLLEGAIYRQYLSNEMIPNTIALTDRAIAKGEKVVIACCYDEELYRLQEYYGDKCVIYNGKMSLRQKEDAISRFTDDDNVMVFIGNIKASSVGITLIASRTLIFNTFSYSDIDNKQMSDRVHRLGQKKPCHIIYQVFKNTYNEHALEICLKKEDIFNTVIKKEEEKR